MNNRTIIGIICIILAVVITFVVSPMANNISEGKVKVVCLAKNISAGSKIKATDLMIVEINKKILPEKYFVEKEKVTGMYAVSDLYKGDVATEFKVSKDANTAKNVLSVLNGKKVAISFTIKTFAGGFSGKLQNGDIISICVTNKKGETVIPKSLKYVKVITTTTKDGVDENEVVENEDGTFELPSTVTVLVNPQQAINLAYCEKNSTMHVALVYRGSEKIAQKFLDYQEALLK